MNERSYEIKTSVTVSRELQLAALVKGAPLGLRTWQDVAARAIEEWVHPPQTSANVEDPRLDRIMRFLQEPQNIEKLIALLRAITEAP